MIDRAELSAWLWLLLVPGLGRAGVRRLLAVFGSPQAVLDATEAGLGAAVGGSMAKAVLQRPEDHTPRLDALLGWLDADQGRSIVTLGDPAYPPQLLQAPDPPLLLHVQGNPAHLAAAAIAVVGSRRPTVQGADNAHRFARRFAEAGYAVVSGLALGVDGAAHEGALDGGGLTVAVVGTGLDRVYPRRHHALAHRIATQGALVSEFLLGTAPLRENFPQRNRIIAGLTQGTLVVEAAVQSGSLITARLAAEAGREVFAIPGSIHASQSRGCHALIRDGAKLVESADDVLDELRQPPLRAVPPVFDSLPCDGDPLLEALGTDPASVDSLQARTGLPTAQLLARLLDLELQGQLARLPGGLYQRQVRG